MCLYRLLTVRRLLLGLSLIFVSPCPPATGEGTDSACCFDALCIVLPESTCIDNGGVPLSGTCTPNPCCSTTTLLKNHDGTWENGFSWTYQLAAPDYGSFAELFDGPGQICGVAFYLTQNNGLAVPRSDVYVWDALEGNPGVVVAVEVDVNLGGPAFWPSVSRHPVAIDATVEDHFYVGLWPNFDDSPYFIAADLDGPAAGQSSRTKAPPGDEFPTGWHPVTTVFGEEKLALGVDVQMAPLATDPLGACCLPDDECRVLTESLCGLAEGSYQGDEVVCVPVTCGGACCFPDGSCEELTFAECETSGGVYQGTGVSCQLSPCPRQGGCCLDGDLCQTMLPEDCDANGGLYLGNDVPCSPVGCNRHAGGVLLVHASPGLVYSGGADYCGGSGLDVCWDVNTSVSQDSPAILHVLAAFPATADPALTAAVFGIRYDEPIQVVDFGHCGDNAVSEFSWPNSDSGTIVLWNEPQTAALTEVFWFAAYNADRSPSVFQLIEHPEEGAWFFDDSVPPVADGVSCLGALGFDSNGERCCPWENRGACCLSSGDCVYVDETSCLDSSGEFGGVNSSCLPNPCETTDSPEWSSPKPLLTLQSSNPTRDGIRAQIELPKPGWAQVSVFDVRGALVATVLEEELVGGRHSVIWPGPDAAVRVGSGVYFLRVQSESGTQVERFVIVE